MVAKAMSDEDELWRYSIKIGEDVQIHCSQIRKLDEHWTVLAEVNDTHDH